MTAPPRDIERIMVAAALAWVLLVAIGYVIAPAADGRCKMTSQGWRCRP